MRCFEIAQKSRATLLGALQQQIIKDATIADQLLHPVDLT
jgi:hypothetical protein